MTTVRDLARVHETLGAADCEALKLKALAVAHFLRAKDKDQAAREIAEYYGDKAKGLSKKSLYRLAQKFNGTLESLMDGRQLRKAAVGGLADNKEFIAFWHELCLTNKRATAPAYRELFVRLRAGETIPGFGDWRQIFASEHGGFMPGTERACPYEASTHVPKGWTLRNLTRLKPNEFALVAARKGTMEATMECLPDIRRTRAGLKSCRVVQIDDMWYEHKVAFGINKHAQRVVEFSMIDVATGKFFGWLSKPVTEREDGKRETLKSRWTRYLLAHLLGTVGIPEEGCLIMGEHGTASADGSLEEALARISGGRIQFGAGGLLSTPLGKGLYEGTPKGNPRYKGLLEGQHALIKNELAAVKGHMGGGREGKSEYVYGMEKQDEQLRKIARVLRSVRPGIESRLDMPFADWLDFAAIIDAMYQAVNGRTEHTLEAWAEQGFMMLEYWDAASGAWVPFARTSEMPDVIRLAVSRAVEAGTVKTRRRRLSPSEAWDLRKSDREWRLEPSVVALEVLGMELSVTCRCDDKLQMRYKDDSTLTDCTVSGILQGGGSLTRGEQYIVWINPLDCFKAYVADIKGRFIGLAKVEQKVRYDDQAAIEAQLGVRQAAIAAERKRLQPAIRRMQMAENARTAKNAVAILGEDPALVAAHARAAQQELESSDAADLDFAAVPTSAPVAPVADDIDLADDLTDGDDCQIAHDETFGY